MTVYQSDNPMHFRDAALSIFVNQTLKAVIFKIIVDGPICDKLNLEIIRFKESYSNCHVVYLKENLGLSNALNKGIDEMQFDVDYIIRTDADDISFNCRIEKQIQYMEDNPEVGIASGQVEIFLNGPENVIGSRCLPLGDCLVEFMKSRTPLNHSCSIIRRSALDEIRYPDTRLPFEDWWICLRFAKKGWKIGVIDQILMSFRGGEDMLKRRHGWGYLKKEYTFFKQIKKEGLMNSKQILKNILLRSIVRLAPKSFFNMIYRTKIHAKKS